MRLICYPTSGEPPRIIAAPVERDWMDRDAGIDGVSISATGEGAMLASSHFGSGVLTLSVNGLFQTEPGYDLLATGPFNSPKDAIQPLTGIIETDWSPFTFTMNWKFTRKRAPIAFERDEPFCMVFPMPRGLVEAVEPEFRSMDEEPAVQDAYRTWSESRQAFNEGLKVPGSEAQAQKWQKDYFRGSGRFGAPPDNHRTKLRPREFRPKR